MRNQKGKKACIDFKSHNSNVIQHSSDSTMQTYFRGSFDEKQFEKGESFQI
jgi:hypothetical protein